MYKTYIHKNSKDILIPTPKMFEAGEYFESIKDNLISIKSLKTSTKKSILKYLSLEVIIIIQYFNI